MGVLKEKSGESFNAARVLMDGRLHNSSIHCSYYSCIQLILDIFYEKQHETAKSLKEGAYKHRVKHQGSHGLDSGVHAFYVQKMREILTQKKDVTEELVNGWHNDLIQLKAARTQSDYGRIPCVPNAASEAFKKAKRILSTLNEIFK